MPRLLIADDDEDLRETLTLVFLGEGYEVEAVADGEQAALAQERRPADLLITDLFMPLRDGLETIAFFHARYPKLPIVAISGGGYTGQTTDHLTVARAAGADASFRKPFDMRELLAAVRRLTPSP
jgi:DNA-binding response OmpR family regulator